MKTAVFWIVFCLVEKSLAIPLKLLSYDCIGNEEYITQLKCGLQRNRKGIALINLEGNITKPLPDLIMNFVLLKKTKGNNFQKFVIDTNESICKLFAKTERSNVGARMFSGWMKYGKYPDRCPLLGYFYIRRYPLDLSFFPSIFPGGDYKISSRLFTGNNVTVIHSVLLFEIKY